MHYLAIECSSPRRSVAVASRMGVLARARCEEGRGTPLLALIGEVLETARLAPSDIAELHVGLGPGSYTGIRSALALAQGWSLGRGSALRGQDSAHACAWAASKLGLTGPAAVVVDAQRGEFYVALHELRPGEIRRCSPLQIATRDALHKFIEDGWMLVGPELPGMGLVGQEVYPDAAALLELAMSGCAPSVSGPLEPIYLRPTTFLKAPRPPIPGEP